MKLRKSIAIHWQNVYTECRDKIFMTPDGTAEDAFGETPRGFFVEKS